VEETPIKITIAETAITARLSGNQTARGLAAQLRLTVIIFKDVNHVAKVATLPRRLSTDGAPAGADQTSATSATRERPFTNETRRQKESQRP
jgi:hypothetical protein